MNKNILTAALIFVSSSIIASDKDVEILNVYKSVEYSTNNHEYKDYKAPVNAVVITIKYNHPKDEVVKTVNGGDIFIVSKSGRKRFGEYSNNVLHSAAFSAEKYRRLYGESFNMDLGNCTVHQYMILNYDIFPNEFDVELVGVGVNDVKKDYKFTDIIIK